MEVLNKIHKKLGGELEGGSLFEEIPEQVLSCTCLNEDDRVLEIGCNIGRNSLVIASIVKPRNLVCIDSCSEYTQLCAKNRDAKNLDFLILPLGISKIPLMQKNWITRPLEMPIPLDHEIVNTVRWDIFKTLYGPFNVLVVDSEGSIYEMLREQDDLLQGFNKIIIENDFDDDKIRFVHRMFVKNGFTCTQNIPFNIGGQEKQFYQIWKK